MTNKESRQNMSVQAIWNVRDARGLSTYEKTFLFIVASRGKAKTYRKTMMNDMNCSTGQLTNIVRSLKEKNLITVHEGFWKDGKKTQTMYTVNEEILETFIPERSPHELASSPHEQGGSPDEQGSSPHGGFKETMKVTKKETEKENTNAPVPGASEEKNPSRAKVDEGSSSDSSLPVTGDASSLPSNENASADTAEDDEEYEIDLGPVIDALLDGAKHPSEARALYLDPNWEPKKFGDMRARWAGFMAEPVLAH